ncbi:MAG: lipopolysaccharide biosynthesis protein [Candidatus Nanopelagicales bacterium]
MPTDARIESGVSVGGTAQVAVGMTIAQVLALAQMLLASRLLGPAEFGVFGSLAVIMLLGSTAMAATQVVLARHAALGVAVGDAGRKAVVAIALGTAAVGLAASPLIAWLLRLPEWRGPVLIALTFVPMTVSGAQLGRLQGRERYRRLALMYVITSAGRALGGVAAAAVWRTADAGAAGMLLGTTLAALAGVLIARVPQAGAPSAGRARALAVEIGHAGHALVALYALTNVDVLLARSQLAAHSAGLYAAGQLVNRAVFFLPQAVLVAAFPRMVASAGGKAQRQTLWAVGGLGLLATAGTALLPGLVLAVIAGSQYAEVTGQLWLFALAGAGFGVAQVLLYARLARHDRRAALVLWVGVSLLIALGVTVGERGVAQLAACAAVVAWTIVLAGLLLAAREPGRRAGAQPRDQ